TGAAGHSIVASAPGAVVTTGPVVSITVITCAAVLLLPQPSLAVHVRVMILVQPTVLVTVTALGAITPWQASVNTGALNTGADGHSIVASATGAVVSITVITCAAVLLLPHPSLAVQVRVMILVQPTVLVTVTALGAITPWQASVNTGALNTGAAGHSIVASAPGAVVTTGPVVSITVITCAAVLLLPHPSLAVQVRVIILVQPTVLVTVTALGAITP